MPVKRRVRKAREFDELKLEDLLYGPGTCLLNGFGYLGDYGDGLWRDKSDEVKTAVLEEMRFDWVMHHRAVLEAWRARDDHDLYIAAAYRGDPAEPWALTEFGDPR